jgi:DNA-binding NarL/FixJ family response regulator
VENHQLIRQGLRALLEKERDLRVVAEAENGREALGCLQECLPQVVILNIPLSDASVLDMTRQLVAAAPHVKIVALAMHAGRHFVTDMFRAGIAAYLLKDAAFEELTEAIRQVIRGKHYLGAGISDLMIRSIFEGDLPFSDNCLPGLTLREREILALLTQGKNGSQIAANLNISLKTVESHTQNIKHKLGLKNSAELTKYAIREGLTSLDS